MHSTVQKPLVMLSCRTFCTRGFALPRKFTDLNKLFTYCSKNSRIFFATSSPFLKISSVKTPNFPESITEGDIRWTSAIGDQVTVDSVIGEIETDKTSLPVVSPYSGKITEFLVEDGSKVTKGQLLCKIDEDSALKIDQSKPSVDKQAKTDVNPQTESKKEPHKEPQKETKKETQAVASATHPTALQRTETRVPINRMRRTIAERLKEAQNTNAMLTTFNEVDMSRAVEIRNKHKESVLKSFGVKLGFMSFFMSASVHALKVQPIVNAVIMNNEIVYRDYIDISVAVSSPKGLVVPIVRNAHQMNAVELEKAVALLADKARKGQLAIEDMEGGTFTISNGGVFGSMLSTPIINIPQSAILGLHAIKDRPVAIDGKVEIRPMMYLALTYDHRLIDGREAVTFLKRIKDCVEDPSNIVLGV